MGSPPSREELEKALRQSRRALPVETAVGCVLACGLWALHRFAGLETWAAWTIGVFGLFGTIGDLINIVHAKRALSRLDAGGVRDEDSGPGVP